MIPQPQKDDDTLQLVPWYNSWQMCAKGSVHRIVHSSLGKLLRLAHDRGRLQKTLREVLDCLPDNSRHTDESWDWCWNQLSDEAQAEVKAARIKGNSALGG